MQPRVIFRTHYQVDEPEFVGILVRKCTSPIEGAYSDSIAQKLTREIRTRGKEFNTAAGSYAVDLARTLGVINERGCWTDKGQLLFLLSKDKPAAWDDRFRLEKRERLAYFRLFLEADGAALAFLGQKVVQYGQVPYQGCDWNSLVRDMFRATYSECRALSQTTVDRVSLRSKIDQLEQRKYRGKTGAHKAYIHLQTMYRLGLLRRANVAGQRVYCMPAELNRDESGISQLQSHIGELAKLEKIIREQRWLELAALIFAYRTTSYDSQENSGLRTSLSELLVKTYEDIMATGTPLCPLSTLIETVQVEMLVGHSVVIKPEDVFAHLDVLRRMYPRAVRFHVDRNGRPAYVLLSESIPFTSLKR